MKHVIQLAFETTVFDTAESTQAVNLAKLINREIYCWKTSGASNWLEKGYSQVDVFGVVILPRGLPSYIHMPNDENVEHIRSRFCVCMQPNVQDSLEGRQN